MNGSSSKRLTQRLVAAWHDRAIVLKALSFGLVGVVNFGVDFALFSIAYFYVGLPVAVANVLSWTVAVSNSYVLNSLTTFALESGRKLRVKDYLAFCVSQLGGLVTGTLTVSLGSYFMPVLLAKLLSIGVGFLVNFSLSHFIVFRARHPRPRDLL